MVSNSIFGQIFQRGGDVLGVEKVEMQKTVDWLDLMQEIEQQIQLWSQVNLREKW